MKITPTTNLDDLSQYMGSDATEADAQAMLGALIAEGFLGMDTSEIWMADWNRILAAI